MVYSSPSLLHGMTFADLLFRNFSTIINFIIFHVIGMLRDKKSYGKKLL